MRMLFFSSLIDLNLHPAIKPGTLTALASIKERSEVKFQETVMTVTHFGDDTAKCKEAMDNLASSLQPGNELCFTGVCNFSLYQSSRPQAMTRGKINTKISLIKMTFFYIMIHVKTTFAVFARCLPDRLYHKRTTTAHSIQSDPRSRFNTIWDLLQFIISSNPVSIALPHSVRHSPVSAVRHLNLYSLCFKYDKRELAVWH